MIKRSLQPVIENSFFKKRAVILYGARQVGKTTLLRMIEEKFDGRSLFLNCDEPDIRLMLTDATSTDLKDLVKGYDLVFIDEAQRVKNIGITLKLLIDEIPGVQVLASGSSSLDLSNEIVEPLTGRKIEFHLHPFSAEELIAADDKLAFKRVLHRRIIYGMYPAVVESADEREGILNELSSSYLYKDLLKYQDIRKPELIEKLLTALALQVGSEVSYNELANTLGFTKETIGHYVDLLEKCFVIFRLGPFSRNLRTELKKMRKIYFWDTGIRNALIRNFNPLELRQDTGALWENFIISERLKYNDTRQRIVARYFWRTHQQQELDYLEEGGGSISAFEIKWGEKKRFKIPAAFSKAYPDADINVINKNNFIGFLT